MITRDASGPTPTRPRRRKRSREAAPTSERGPAYIRRSLPTLDVLDEDRLATIESHADKILQEIGVEFRGDQETLRLWRDAGADVKRERVRFDPGLVRSIVRATAPRDFVHHARNPDRSVRIGGENVVFAPGYGSPFVRDLEGGRRYGTIADFRNFVKLTYLSPWLHHSGGTVCEPVDLPVNKRHLDMVRAHVRCSDKPFLGSITAPERARDSVDMARIVFGRDFTEAHCVVMGNVNVNSPLVFDGQITGAVRAYSGANQGILIVPFILGGAMGPVTTAGAIAQALAEAMVGVALTQLVRPGAPAILGNFLSSMSLRSGAPTFGMPEPAVGYFAVGQLARRLGVPLRCGGALTASKIADAQAAQESANSLWPTVLCGANYVLHSAGWLEAGLTMGYEKFIIDADQLGMMHVVLGGLVVDENTLAMDAFREVSPGKHFLGCAHTMANYRTAFYDSKIADNDSFEQWTENGSKDAAQRANERCKKMLEAYEPPPIDEARGEELDDFVARRKSATPDSWV